MKVYGPRTQKALRIDEDVRYVRRFIKHHGGVSRQTTKAAAHAARQEGKRQALEC